MSELSPDEFSIATAGADLGRRKAAAHDAPRFHPFAATSVRAESLTADMTEGLPSIAWKWGHAPARCRVVLRGAA